MSEGLPIPVEVSGEATAKYEHVNITKHLIFEYRSDELEICKPKIIPRKPHFYSKKKIWLVHYKKEGEPDIKLLD